MADLNEQLLKTLTKFKDDMGSIKDKCINDVNTNLENIEDPKMKEFFKGSMKSVLDGELTADQFMENYKNQQ